MVIAVGRGGRGEGGWRSGRAGGVQAGHPEDGAVQQVGGRRLLLRRPVPVRAWPAG